jgi:hypothetical protein
VSAQRLRKQLDHQLRDGTPDPAAVLRAVDDLVARELVSARDELARSRAEAEGLRRELAQARVKAAELESKLRGLERQLGAEQRDRAKADDLLSHVKAALEDPCPARVLCYLLESGSTAQALRLEPDEFIARFGSREEIRDLLDDLRRDHPPGTFFVAVVLPFGIYWSKYRYRWPRLEKEG